MRLGDIEFRCGPPNDKPKLIRWHKPRRCAVIAFFEKGSEGYDMLTVGERFFKDENAWIVGKHALAFLNAVFAHEDK